MSGMVVSGMRSGKKSMHTVLTRVLHERLRQDAKWGALHDAQHDLGGWLAILQRELEEARVAPNDAECLTEILHVAAVAVAALEWHGVPEQLGGG